jgi:hypothetical protein
MIPAGASDPPYLPYLPDLPDLPDLPYPVNL